jgi:hypothetical protein
MATYNIVDGTGGLDASIRFETDRAEVSGISQRNARSRLAHTPRTISEPRQELREHWSLFEWDGQSICIR